jgi:hypothetical protein
MGQLKELGAMAKKFQNLLFPGYWKWLVDLDLLRDYKPTQKIEDFVDEIKNWSMGEAIHQIGGSTAKFLEWYRLGVREFLDQAPKHLDRFAPLSRREWGADPMNWARSGSSDGKRLQIEVEGRIRKARKSKWSSAIAMSQEEVMSGLTSRLRQRNKAVQKRELKKVRPVVAGDLPLYLKMSYVSHWLEPALYGHPRSTLFFSAKQQLALWTEMAEETLKNTVKIPIDQSEFDHKVNKEMIQIKNEEIERQIALWAPPSIKGELLETMELIKYGVSGGTTQVGDQLIPYEKGVMSGWRWTALYDTMSNAGDLYCARRMVRERCGVDPILKDCLQGDDCRVVCPDWGSACALWAGFKEMEFNVNPAKFFIETRSDEFLRQVATPGLTGGYPARAVPAMVYRNPVSRELLRGEDRIREMAQSWNQVASRANNSRVLDVMIGDISRSNKIKEEVTKRLFNSPACVGGLGCGSGEWWGVRKARERTDWKWVGIPAGTQALTSWGVTADELMGVWHDNVEPPPEAKWVFEPYELVQASPVLKIFTPGAVVSETSAPMFPSARPEVPASVFDVAKRRATRGDTALFEACLDIRSSAWDPWLRTNASKSIWIDWVNGRLPFSTPIIPGYGALQTSILHQRCANAMWDWVLARRKPTYNLLLRAAYTAELNVRELLERVDVVVTG